MWAFAMDEQRTWRTRLTLHLCIKTLRPAARQDFSNSYPLRQRRSDETIREDRRSPLLLEAAAEGQTARINYLRGLGVNLDYRDDHGLTALHHAALSGYEDTTQALLDAGATINATAFCYGTPICLAALKARSNIVSMLLARRARTEGTGQLLQSCFHCAVGGGDARIIQILLDRGCDLNQRSMPPTEVIVVPELDLPTGVGELLDFVLDLSDGLALQIYIQPLHVAVMTRDIAVIDLLMKAGAVLESRDYPEPTEMLTPLKLAAICGYFEVLKSLIEHGAEPSVVEEVNGRTALMWCAECGHQQCAEFLIEAGANIDARERCTGETALFNAMMHGHEDIALLLIRKGAALAVTNVSGHGLLDLALKWRLEVVAQELVRRGVRFRRLARPYSLIRLWHVETHGYRSFAFFDPDIRPPPYVTLSHLWTDDEITSQTVPETASPLPDTSTSKSVRDLHCEETKLTLSNTSTSKGLDILESKTSVELMDHLTLRGAQRNARDTEILVSLVRSAAEMRQSFQEMKDFVTTKDREITASAERQSKPSSTVRTLGQSEKRHALRQSGQDIQTERKGILRKMFAGSTASMSREDLKSAEDMLAQISQDVEDLKDQQVVRTTSSRGNSRGLDSSEFEGSETPESFGWRKSRSESPERLQDCAIESQDDESIFAGEDGGRHRLEGEESSLECVEVLPSTAKWVWLALSTDRFQSSGATEARGRSTSQERSTRKVSETLEQSPISKQSRYKSQTSLLIEYFQGSKDSTTKPSVKVNVIPSSRSRTANGGHEDSHITGTGKGRKPSYTRRISLGRSGNENTS